MGVYNSCLPSGYTSQPAVRKSGHGDHGKRASYIAIIAKGWSLESWKG